jgi:membrane-associated HD superfamily phosphohydrolase
MEPAATGERLSKRSWVLLSIFLWTIAVVAAGWNWSYSASYYLRWLLTSAAAAVLVRKMMERSRFAENAIAPQLAVCYLGGLLLRTLALAGAWLYPYGSDSTLSWGAAVTAALIGVGVPPTAIQFLGGLGHLLVVVAVSSLWRAIDARRSVVSRA